MMSQGKLHMFDVTTSSSPSGYIIGVVAFTTTQWHWFSTRAHVLPTGSLRSTYGYRAWLSGGRGEGCLHVLPSQVDHDIFCFVPLRPSRRFNTTPTPLLQASNLHAWAHAGRQEGANLSFGLHAKEGESWHLFLVTHPYDSGLCVKG